MRDKGAVRPLWLCVGVLTCVATGAVVSQGLWGADDDNSTTVGIVQGEVIDTAKAPSQAPKARDPEVNNEELKELSIEKEPEPVAVVRDPTLPKKLTTEDQVKDPARLKPEEIKKGFAELTFDTLGDWTYEFPDLTKDEPVRPDPTPERLKKMTGKKYAIRGFMIPFKLDGEDVTEFLLVRNQSACCFGVEPRMNEWLHVRMAKGKKAPYAVDIPITVYGKFEAAELIEKGFVMSLYRIEASEVEEPPIFR